MKRITLVVLLLILGGLAAPAQSQTPAAASQVPAVPPKPGTAIAVIDFQGALFDSDPGKEAVKQIEKGLEQVKTNFDKVQKELAELQTKLQNAKTDAEKSAITRDMDTKTKDAKRLQEDGQELSMMLQEKYLTPVADLLRKMIDEYAKENNLAVVLDPTTQDTNIVFAAKSSDITSEVTRRMNKDPKTVPPGATPAPPTKPPANN